MALIAIAILLAAILGFAAHRASICTVRAVAEIMSSRSGFMLASIGKSVLWVWAVTIPLFWLMPAAGTGLSGWSLTGFAVLGGFLFGLGAAFNGGCAYSTMARFVDGDGKMLATIAGFALGVLCFIVLAGWRWLPRPSSAPALVGSLLAWAMVPALLALAFLAWATYEGARLWRTREAGARILSPYALPTFTALAVGVAAGLVMMRWCFGIEARVECRNDVFITDTWTRPILAPPRP